MDNSTPIGKHVKLSSITDTNTQKLHNINKKSIELSGIKVRCYDWLVIKVKCYYELNWKQKQGHGSQLCEHF